MFKKIGILCAGDSELAPFLPWLKTPAVSQKAMLTIHEGKIEELPVAVLFSGVCKVNAAIAAQILIDAYSCDAIINAGTAGGMEETLQIFDTVVSTECAYWDVAADILTEFHPWISSIYFPADQTLLSLAKKIAAETKTPGKIVFGRMVTGESFIETHHRNQILSNFQPYSVDMETASIAHTCYVNQIPYLAIRTITDTADHAGMATFEENCKKASQIAAEITRCLLKEIQKNNA